MDNKKEIKEIRELVKLYFDYNPGMNRGIAFKSKAFDIISSYYNIHKKSYEDIKHCIESKPMCTLPIWDQFSQYFKNKNEKPTYKSEINNSQNPNDWF